MAEASVCFLLFFLTLGLLMLLTGSGVPLAFFFGGEG